MAQYEGGYWRVRRRIPPVVLVGWVAIGCVVWATLMGVVWAGVTAYRLIVGG